METEQSASSYSESHFWKKLAKVAKRCGQEVVEKALMLFYTAQHPDTPKWAKGVIYGSLAYFIIPLDAIPDFLPAVGFTDDLTALIAGLGAVAMHMTPEIKARAQEKARVLLSRDFYRETPPSNSEKP